MPPRVYGPKLAAWAMVADRERRRSKRGGETDGDADVVTLGRIHYDLLLCRLGSGPCMIGNWLANSDPRLLGMPALETALHHLEATDGPERFQLQDENLDGGRFDR